MHTLSQRCARETSKNCSTARSIDNFQRWCCARGCRHIVLVSCLSSACLLNNKAAAVNPFGRDSLIVVEGVAPSRSKLPPAPKGARGVLLTSIEQPLWPRDRPRREPALVGTPFLPDPHAEGVFT